MRSSAWRTTLVAMAVLLVVAVPIAASGYVLHLAIQVGIFAILALSLNLVAGYAGQMSLGHAAFWAIGAYASALVTARLEWPFLAGFAASVIVTGLFSLFLGIPSIRVSDIYLAVVTISFGLIVQILLFQWDWLTGGASGIYNIPRPSIGPLVVESREQFYVLALAALGFVVLLTWRLMRSYAGRALRAIREDPQTAEAMGVNTTYYKVLAFFLSAAFAGAAGSLYAHYARYINPDPFTILVSINVLVMIVVGGLASIPGALIGAAVVYVLPEALRFLGVAYYAIFGVFLILMVLFVPDGLVSLPARLRRPPR